MPREGGHEHHLRAINRVRGAGSIARAVEQGLIKDGIMHACVTSGASYILAGSIRDDGPLPDVVTDTLEAQRLMRAEVRRGVDLVLVLSSMLHQVDATLYLGAHQPLRLQRVADDVGQRPVVADRAGQDVAGARRTRRRA